MVTRSPRTSSDSMCRDGKALGRAILISSAVVTMVLAGLGWWGWSRAAGRPEWWTAPVGDVQMRSTTASNLENSVVTALHKQRGTGGSEQEWTLTLTEDEANAWLSTRLPKWAANQFPDSPAGDGTIGLVQARFEPDMIRLGIQFFFGSGEHRSETGQEPETVVPLEQDPAGGHVMSLSVRPEIDTADQKLSLRIDALAIGRLALPASQAISVLGDLLEGVPEAKSAVSGLPISPMIRLVDERSVRLVDIEVQDRLLIMRLRTSH